MGAPRHLWSDDWRAESAATAADLASKRGRPADSADEHPTEALPRRGKPGAWTRLVAWLREATRAVRKPTRAAPKPTPPATKPAPPAPKPTPPAPKPAPEPRPRARTQPPRPPSTPRAGGGRLRVLLPGALAALIAGGAAYAAISLATGTSPLPSASASGPAPAWLGIQMESMPFGLGGVQFGSGFGQGGQVSPFAGALITAVAPGSPAAAAGLQPGDMLTGIAGQQVTSPATVESVIAGLHAGDHVEIQFSQGLTDYTTQVTLSRPPANSP